MNSRDPSKSVGHPYALVGVSVRYSSLKPMHSKGRVISKPMRVAGSKSGEVGRGWPAQGAQLTYNDTRLEEENPRGNA